MSVVPIDFQDGVDFDVGVNESSGRTSYSYLFLIDVPLIRY